MPSVLRCGAVVVLLLGSSIVLPPRTGPLAIPEAAAQLPPIPIPDPPDLPGLPDPVPDPEPSPDPSPPPEDEPEEKPDEEPGAPSGGSPDGDESSQDASSGDIAGDPNRATRGPAGSGFEVPTFDYARIPGAYSTDGLMMAAARLRGLGWPRDRVMAKVFPPFIIAGRANWIDSWGAARYGPGPIIRRHEGQDVFCEYGDPILAATDGVVDYGEGGLGGIVARLHRPEGGYWYYAHLSDTNSKKFPEGAAVQQGDVLGYCGNSGNAATTPPHVHFGWYRPNGIAGNPMRVLVSWLRRAERNAALTVARASGERVGRLSSLISARRFGDELIPGVGTTAPPAPEALAQAAPANSFAQSAKESAD